MTTNLKKIRTDALDNYSQFASKYRGDNLDQKLDRVLERYEKVVLDSEGDETTYRIGFSKAHKQIVKMFASRGMVSPERLLELLIGEAAAQIKATVQLSQKERTVIPGPLDAYNIILAELLLIQEAEND